MKKRHVVVQPYDPRWKAAFEAIRQELEAARLVPEDIEKYMQHKDACIRRLHEECGL